MTSFNSPLANFRRFGRGAVNLVAPQGEFLSNEQIAKYAPTVFKDEAHSSRSERFVHIPTHELLAGMAKAGFLPVRVSVGGSSDIEKRNFTKHMIRFRRAGELNAVAKVGDSIAEAVMMNAHDGTSSYQLHAGLFRLVCTNGMVVSDGDFGHVKVGHSGRNTLDKVIEGTYTVLSDAEAAIEHAEELRGITLSREEQNLFGTAALALRFENPEEVNIRGEQVVRARRSADVGNNLWLAFNRAQENLIRGGLSYTHTDDKGKVSFRSTRPVQSVDGDVKLNKALWALAQGYADLKRGQAAAA